MKLRKRAGPLILLAAMAFSAFSVQAEELRIGIATETTSIDPHFFSASPNVQIADHIFEPLVWKDERQKLQPRLAVSWSVIDDTIWEFKLREGVLFHDGSPFTADDVIFTFERAAAMTGTSPTGRYVRNKSITKVDDMTVRITTEGAYPLMAAELAVVHIISAKNGRDATTEDYNSGDAAIGTGPYRFTEWVQGDRIVLERNDDYWGKAPEWDRVVMKPIPSSPVRVAALLGGDVDMIDYVPTNDLPTLRSDERMEIAEIASYRVIFLILDSNRSISPYVHDNAGQPLFPNPLRNWVIRKAISKAINREAIVARIMQGAAVPASQLVPDFQAGYDADLQVETYDPDGAKEMLAEAGYPDGFRLTVHCPNDRYVNDAQICEAVAQMLTQVGIETEVVTMPKSVFFTRSARGDPWGNPEFSFVLYGAGSDTGDALTPLVNNIGTRQPGDGFGFSNRGRYSNIDADKRWEMAMTMLDPVERERLIREGNAIATRDLGYIPLHSQTNVWALRKGLVFDARVDEKSHAMGVSSLD